MRSTVNGPSALAWFAAAAAATLVTAALPSATAALADEPAQAASALPAPPVSARELEAALAAVERRVEEQRQAGGATSASEVVDRLQDLDERVAALARAVAAMRAERDSLRDQLAAARATLREERGRLAAAFEAALSGEDRLSVALAEGSGPGAEPAAAAAGTSLLRTAGGPGGGPDPAAATVPTAAPRGGFALVVASVSDPAAVAGEWQRLARLYPSLAELGPQPGRPVSLTGRGTFHQVLAGSFERRSEAQAACQRLREEGGECVVVAAP